MADLTVEKKQKIAEAVSLLLADFISGDEEPSWFFVIVPPPEYMQAHYLSNVARHERPQGAAILRKMADHLETKS